VRNLHFLVLGGAKIELDIHVWVDHDRFACTLAPNQIARLGEPVVVKASEEHVEF
jgi:hypothetical protein